MDPNLSPRNDSGEQVITDGGYNSGAIRNNDAKYPVAASSDLKNVLLNIRGTPQIVNPIQMQTVLLIVRTIKHKKGNPNDERLRGDSLCSERLQ